MKFDELPWVLQKPKLTIRCLDAARIIGAIGSAIVGYSIYEQLSRSVPPKLFPLYDLANFVGYALTFILSNFLRREIERVQHLLPAEPEAAPDERRRRAKRANEHIKLLASFISNIGSAVLLGAVIMPSLLTSAARTPLPVWMVVVFALGCHALAQGVLLAWKSDG